jgi:sugar lactone lactonase YvrE
MLFFLALIFFNFPPFAVAQNLLRSPESIAFDSLYNRYLLSNYNTGSIVQIDSAGNQDYLVFQENAIQGLEIVGNAVYVGCGSSVKGFDLATGDSVMDVVIPGVQNLNDVTSDTSGNLYASDVYGHAIYKIRLSDHVYSTFATGGILNPNGIYFDAETNRLLVCSFRFHSPIQAIDLSDSSVTTVTTTSISNCDGITRDNSGNYYVSSWTTLTIYRFDPTFTNPPEVFYTSNGGAADIACNRRDNILAIPLMWANSYDLVPLSPTLVSSEDGKKIPTAFNLRQNSPNPFNPSTTITIQIPDDSVVRRPVNLAVYDLHGRLVKKLIDRELDPGIHHVVWDGRGERGGAVNSGIYLYILRRGSEIHTRKMTMVK